MGILTDNQIKEAIKKEDLKIEPFDESNLEPASYDMSLGEEAITSSHREKLNPAQKGLLTISAGDFALITTHEKVALSTKMAGHIGLRSHYAKKGLILLSGPQIDPGFKGVLVLGLSNLSPRDIVIPYREKLCTIEFYALSQPATRPYTGEYQEQAGIKAQDLENLVEAQGMTFGQVITTLRELTQNVGALSESVNFLKWFFPVALAVGIAIIGIIVRLL